ncbi:hypothetical protein BV379_05075 [Rhodovulum sulfidophilum]|nr:hypothetical protein BV379_05075 [Rhodovulum sulfidophilum]
MRHALKRNGALPYVSIGAASLCINTLALAAPLFILQVYDRIIPNHSENTAALIGLGVLCALALETALKIARSKVLAPLAIDYEVRASCGAARHLFHADLAAFERVSPGAHMERLAAVAQRRFNGTGQTLLAICDFPFLFVFMWMIWILGGPVIIAPALGAIALAVAAAPANRSAREALARALSLDDQRYDFLLSTLSSLPSLKVANLERPVLRRYEGLQKRRLAAQGEAFTADQRLTDLSQLVVQLSIIGVIVLGSLLILQGRMSIGGLSASTLLAGRFLALIRNLILLASRLQTSSIGREQMDAIFKIPVRSASSGILDASQAPPRLSLRGVVFDDNDGKRVLDGVDLDLREGHTVGLVGDNGSGKSILLALAAGLYSPTSGEVLLGGHPLSDYTDQSLRRTIALVSQQETLFAGSILENISMFAPERVDAALRAAERTGLTELIKPLPKGFATIVGDTAADGLPRGVVQRIALCRAMALDPQVLLFDDANSAIDDQGDEKVAELFADIRERCAILFVSHRPSVLGRADAIVRLANGRISTVEGTF